MGNGTEHPAEEPLPGGNLAPVVRVGDTVRRSAGPWTPAVHQLLDHLEAAGYPHSPRVLGFDERGREILTFIPGETVGAARPWPSWAWSEATLVQAGGMLREYHEAVADFRPSGAQVWRFTTDVVDDTEIVCHNDFAPYNIVWSAGRVVGVIDWDLASPGEPLSDVAFAAWSFAPIHTPEHCRALGAPTDTAGRLRSLCDAYGLVRTDRLRLMDAIAGRMQAAVEGIAQKASEGDPVFRSLITGGHLQRMRDDAGWLAGNRDGWHRALCGP